MAEPSSDATAQTVIVQPSAGDQIVEAIINYGLKVIAAVLILVIGLWLAGKIKSIFRTILEKKEVDPTLIGFFSGLLHGLFVTVVLIAAINRLGIPTASLVAVLGAAGLAVGLALQGSLSNFASGVLLILFKPFKAGNFVKAGGEAGFVVEVGILTTELKTPDNVKVILPNSQVMGGAIVNFSGHETRRVDMVVGVSYSDDLNKAKQLMEEIIAADDRVLKDPEPQVAVSNLGDSSVDFVVRPWVNAADFWDFKFDFTQAVKEKFDAEGISIPFPQRDVHLIQQSDA